MMNEDDNNEKFDSSIIPELGDLDLQNTTVLSGGLGLGGTDSSSKTDLNSSIVVPTDLVLKDDFDGDDFTSGPNVVIPPKGLEVVEEELDEDDDEIDDEERERRRALRNAKRFPTYTCPKCHVTYCTLHKLSSSRCFYCNSSGVKKVSEYPFTDLKFVPFMDSLKEAGETFKKKIRFNPLVPFSFRSKKVLKRIRKVFVQCSLFDIVTEGKVSFLGADKITNVKGAPMQTFECSYSTKFEYNKLLCSNSSFLKDNILSSINNYGYTTVRDFDEAMLGDSSLMVGDLNPDVIATNAMDKTVKYSVNVVRGNIGHELKRVNQNDITPSIKTFTNIAIPIYYLNLTYKGKDYHFIMNGQTGETFIDLPISGASIAIFSVLVVLVVFLICFLIALAM